MIEGIRRYGDVIFRLNDHVVRLRNSAKMYGMVDCFHDWTIHKLIQACLDVARANPDDTYIRPIVYRGAGIGGNPQGVDINIAIITRPWGKYLNSGLYNGGADVRLSSWRRCSADQLPVFAKGAANYVRGQLAKLAAVEAGFAEKHPYRVD